MPTTATYRIQTASGKIVDVPADIKPSRVAGIDGDGRIVVDDFDAHNAEPTVIGGWTSQPFMFGLTLPGGDCPGHAYDKGVEDGVVCRLCYGTHDVGHYLYRDADGSFPGLDPVEQYLMPVPKP